MPWRAVPASLRPALALSFVILVAVPTDAATNIAPYSYPDIRPPECSETSRDIRAGYPDDCGRYGSDAAEDRRNRRHSMCAGVPDRPDKARVRDHCRTSAHRLPEYRMAR